MQHEAPKDSKPFIFLSKRAALVIGVIIAIALWLLWPFLTNNGPVYFADEDEHFRYGSIGGEATDGFPYWVVKVLPTAFSDLLPPGEGWTSFGFIQEPDHEFPIGFARSTRPLPIFGSLLELDVVTQNCATCHVGTLRGSADQKKPDIISTMPGFTVNLPTQLFAIGKFKP